jgi:diguanylate cyclase (GGDEF)-like protein
MVSSEASSLAFSAFDLLVHVLRAQRASLLFTSAEAPEELVIVRAVGLPEQVIRESRIRIGTPIAGQVARQKRPLLVRDLTAQAELRLRPRVGYSTLSFASVPILLDGEALGVINVADKADNQAFSDLDFSILVRFASHIAACVACEGQARTAHLQARTDALTGLLNRRALDEHLKREVARSRRLGQPGCLLVLDLDRFKRVNDTFGHPIGDSVLIAVGHAIQMQVRSYDEVFRLGGDEFAVLLPSMAPERARETAKRIEHIIGSLQQVGATPLGPVRLSASTGWASFPSDSDVPQELLARADALMYAAKAQINKA